jgi:hypothetical protein
MQKTMGELVDALLYLGPQDLRLKEQLPADVAPDVDYRKEVQRREALPGVPGAAPFRGCSIVPRHQEPQQRTSIKMQRMTNLIFSG